MTDDQKLTDTWAQRITAVSKLSTATIVGLIAFYTIYAFAGIMEKQEKEYAAWILSHQRIMETCIGLKESLLPGPSEVLGEDNR